MVIEFGNDGTAQIQALDLTGDVWRDFQHYLTEAKCAEARGDELGRNRALRAAVANLFAHLDGVASKLHAELKQRKDFVAYRPPQGKFCTLKNQIDDIHRYTALKLGGGLRRLDLRLKLLRDILMHPAITKQYHDFNSGQKIELTEADIFSLATKDLETCGRRIDEWLSKVCNANHYDRFWDTKRVCNEWTEILGQSKTGPRDV
jgi:hypothetical protein